MSYIYDILLNFNDELYDFYEWNKKDSITHIKKIPILKINSKQINDIILNNIILDTEFLKKIENKTETYSKNKIIKYSILLTDGFKVIALNIANKIKYSKLLLEEENDILDITNRLDKYNLKYKIISKKNIEYKTRYEKELELKINNINNIDELKYLYYDCFNKKCDNINKIKKELNSNFSNISNKINDFLNIKKCIKY